MKRHHRVTGLASRWPSHYGTGGSPAHLGSSVTLAGVDIMGGLWYNCQAWNLLRRKNIIMPIKIKSELPAFKTLESENIFVMTDERASLRLFTASIMIATLLAKIPTTALNAANNTFATMPIILLRIIF